MKSDESNYLDYLVDTYLPIPIECSRKYVDDYFNPDITPYAYFYRLQARCIEQIATEFELTVKKLIKSCNINENTSVEAKNDFEELIRCYSEYAKYFIGTVDSINFDEILKSDKAAVLLKVACS